MNDPGRTPDSNDASQQDAVPHASENDSTGALKVRCPECGETTALVVEVSWENITCSHCGLRLRLVDDIHSSEHEIQRINHFELIESIGEGSYGTVWKAYDHDLLRNVAIKLPRRGHTNRADAERILREARAAALLRHPNIVAIHEVGKVDERIYIVSDWVDGSSLRQWLAENRLTYRDAAQFCASVAAALDHAHRRKVIHRDLKPSNILLDGRRTPFVTDFGLARRLGADATVTTRGVILGTPQYMPPEQARGESHDADERSDIWSLGVILYELLAGQPPFQGSWREVLYQITQSDPPDLRQRAPETPPELIAICRKCLHKERGERYQTADELSQDLDRFLVGGAEYVIPAFGIGRMIRWCRNYPWIAASLVLLGSFVLVMWGLEVVREYRREVTRREFDGPIHSNALGPSPAADVALDKATPSSGRATTPADGTNAPVLRQDTELELLDKGMAFAKSYFWDDAEQAFSKAIEANPTLASVWNYRGNMYLSLGIFDLAAADFAQAFERNPLCHDHDALRHLVLRLVVGDVTGFERSLNQLLARPSAETPTPFEFAWALLESPKTPADAIRIAEIADTWPQDGVGDGFEPLMALAYLRANRPRDALATCHRFQEMETGPRAHRYYPIIALAHHQLGQPADALAALQQATSVYHDWINEMLRPANDDWQIHYDALAHWPIDPVDWLVFRQTYQEACRKLGLEPDGDGQLLIIRARGLAALRRSVQAVTEYNKALRLHPGDESLQLEAHRVQALLYAGLRLYQLTATEYRRATELSPNDHYLWRCRAVAYLACGNRDEFLVACKELVRRFRQTSDPMVAESVIVCCVLDAESVEDWDSLLPLVELAAGNNHRLHLDCFVHYRAGRFKQVLDINQRRDRSLTLGIAASVYYLLAMTHHQLGNADEAQRQFALGENWVATADGIDADRKLAGFHTIHWGAWTERPRTLAIQREARELIYGSENGAK